MQQPYYNTTHAPRQQREQYEKQAVKQETLVWRMFVLSGSGCLSASQCHALLVNNGYIARNCPLTSIRRAITNLATAGRLEKTAEQVDGPFGRPEYCWRLPAPAQPVQLKLL